MKKTKDILCQCGHEKHFHKSVGTPIWDELCNGGRIRDQKVGNYIYICICPKYIPDNLLHIEAIAKKKKLI